MASRMGMIVSICGMLGLLKIFQLETGNISISFGKFEFLNIFHIENYVIKCQTM